MYLYPTAVNPFWSIRRIVPDTKFRSHLTRVNIGPGTAEIMEATVENLHINLNFILETIGAIQTLIWNFSNLFSYIHNSSEYDH